MISGDTLLNLSFETTRELGRNIRLHPNGFIQIDFPNDQRLHVWDHRLHQYITRGKEIHDHIFSFRSTILKGCLKDSRYIVLRDFNSGYRIFEATKTDREDTVLAPHDLHTYRVVMTTHEKFRRGQTYFCPIREFHKTVSSSMAISMISKGVMDPWLKSRIIVTPGASTHFESRYTLDVDLLWKHVEEVFAAPDSEI